MAILQGLEKPGTVPLYIEAYSSLCCPFLTINVLEDSTLRGQCIVTFMISEAVGIIKLLFITYL